jgi:glutathione synthase/RimK-type ligase-like ATP-grasp enzyme
VRRARLLHEVRSAAPTRRNAEVNLELSGLMKGAAAAAVIVVGLSACASTPIPNEKIAVAKASVQRAEQSGAPELAPVELATARDKLTRAEKAAADHDPQPATLLAEQANVDAQLAEATANQQRSHKAAVEFDASMQALRQESLRSTQPTQ